MDKIKLSKKLNKLKDVVKTQSLKINEGILIKSGYMIASNSEMTVKAKLDESKSDEFVIPDQALDLIDKLPIDSTVEIINRDPFIDIKAIKIKASFPTIPTRDFMYDYSDCGKTVISLPAEKLKTILKHVIYAAADKHAKPVIASVYFNGTGDRIDIVGCDGHRLAWDKLVSTNMCNFNVPKATVEKLLSIDLEGDVSISHDTKYALFKTAEYEIYTRLIYGDYIAYTGMFDEKDIYIDIDPKLFAKVLTRYMAACGEKYAAAKNKAVVLSINDKTVRVHSAGNAFEYSEDISVDGKCDKEMSIAFNPKLLYEAARSFEDEQIRIFLKDGMTPVVLRGGGEYKALVLPVKI